MPGEDICVILATHNGTRFLREQVASIRASNAAVSRLFVRDDCSTDGTFDLLNKLAADWPEMRIEQNDARLGPAKNFLSGVQALPHVPDYLAFADQDDVWHCEKLAVAIRALKAEGGRYPLLYCSRQRLVCEDGTPIGLSPDHRQVPSFSNALAQNIVTGCTAVLNAPAVELVRMLPLPDVEWHDWWLYMLVTGAGGRVLFDRQPHIDYRQHRDNKVGAPRSRVDDLMRRVPRLFSGRSRALRDSYFEELQSVRHILTDPNRAILDTVLQFRRASPASRVRHLGTLPGRRGSLMETLAYRVLCLAGRL